MKNINIKISPLDAIGRLFSFLGIYSMVFGLYQLWKIDNKMWKYGFIVAAGAMAVTIGFAIAYDCGIHKKDSEDE